MLPSFPSLQDPSHCSSGCTRPRPAKPPPGPTTEPCVSMCPLSPGAGGGAGVGGLGLSGRPARGCWQLGPSRRLTTGKCRFFTRLSGMPRVPRKPGLAVLCLFFSLPRRYQELGTAEPRPLPPGADPKSLLRSFLLWRLQCRGGGGSGCTPLSITRPLPAPGELGQQPRDAGAAGLRAPAPQLAVPAAPGRRGGGGGERCALLETRC